MTGAIRASLRAPLLEAFTKVEDWEAMADMLRRQHRQILDALRAGEAEEAARLTAEHIRAASAALPELPGA